MKQLPTAEEFMYQNDILNPHKKITQTMIEFAKLHVQQALESAAEKLPYDDRLNQDIMVKQSILNAYPLEQIK